MGVTEMLSKIEFGDTPIGNTIVKRGPTKARTDLLRTLFEFLDLDPTGYEMEMLDEIISCAMWSYKGYSAFFDFAVKAYRIIHKEDPSWTKKKQR